MDKNLYEEIKKVKENELTETFAELVYKGVFNHKYSLLILGKCTQVDTRSLPDTVYQKYLKLLEKEIEVINLKVIVLFGNQISSIVLGQKISVSLCRKKLFIKIINGKKYKFYSVYYPVGNGRFNIDKLIEDIKWIIENLNETQEIS